VRGNALLLDSALRNLVENAVRHTPTGTQIEVQAGLDSVQERAWVQVCDDGRRDAAPDHVPPVDSLHLGHEIVSRVMQAHGGRFMVAGAARLHHLLSHGITASRLKYPVTKRLPKRGRWSSPATAAVRRTAVIHRRGRCLSKL
jgi:hypothetical protein